MQPIYTLPESLQAFQTALAFPDVFRPRAQESHKGTYGTLAIIGGATGMSGAVVLAATAAMYQGCGKVWAGFNQATLPFAIIPERPEIMLATATQLMEHNDVSARVIGCGFGLDGLSEQLLPQILSTHHDQPLLLDADALTLLACSSELAERLKSYKHIILTPHPAEAARLLGTDTPSVQADRQKAVTEISRKYGATVVLKGHHTLVATADGIVYTNTSGNAGLATAGSGDVLSGIIGSLLAQGIPAFQAACAGVWLHGAAADVIKHSSQIETGMLAGEIAPAARWLRNILSKE
ncbi:NAD(P)H-hydrate dehydratase [Neisseria sp. P0004.S004]|jgi:YjeF C-terminal domain protein|uniref:NAD(P)H-hydrate dehydratase n=1 Tax=Neisseria TaxID=482 RepID=UPI00066A13FC|nr:NAD(P)H-hydrate dehydratase [Neisseria lactamica]